MKIWWKAAVLVIAGCIAVPCAFAYYGESDILLAMTSKADQIVRVTVTNLTVAPPLHEAGVDHWTATCQVVEPIKGVLKKDQKISIIGRNQKQLQNITLKYFGIILTALPIIT